MRTVYALLVAIDEYFPPVTNLAGCKNDIAAVGEVLRARAGAAGDRLELRTLTDRDATREALVAVFREHLGQAGPEDAALFYYSGHGSQEPAPPELWHLEPDRLNETLVCADSRAPGGWDLADKELGALLGEVADTGAHVTAVLDCCHSGSGVRGDAVVRLVDADTRVRPAASYLPGVVDPDGARSVGDDSAVRRIVAMAACRSDQTAKERTIDGARRGVFSSSLVELLRSGPATYRDLHRAAAASVRTLADDQTPVLEALGAGDVDAAFLGGLAAPPPHPFTVSRHDGAWTLDGGSAHGVATGGEVAFLDLVGGALVTTGTVTTVHAVRSVVVPDDEAALDAATTYRVSLTGGGTPTAVALVVPGPDDDGGGGADPHDVLAAARDALAAHPTLLREDPTTAELALRATADGWRLTAADGEDPLVADVPGPPADGARVAVDRLAHVVRWRDLLARRNPGSTIAAGTVALEVTGPSGATVVGADGVARVATAPGSDVADVEVVVRNDSGYRLYAALLGLTEAFGVFSLLPGGGVWLDPGAEAWVVDAAGARRLHMTLAPGAGRARDVLKLVVSTVELDAQSLTQPELPPPAVTRGNDDARGFSLGAPPGIAADDWRTEEVTVETVRS